MYFHLPGDARIYGRLRTYYTHAAYMPAWEMCGQPTTPSHRRSLGLATPPPAAIPGWPFSNVPQRRRVVGQQANCVNCVHAPRTPPHGLVLPLPLPCMLPRRSQSHKHVRIDVCMVSAGDKPRANDDVRSHDGGLTTRSTTGTADNPEHDQPKLEPK
jgi:hypothetical protein